MKADWFFLFEPVLKIIAFENSGYGDIAREFDDIGEVHGIQPVCVVEKFGFFWIEDLEQL